MRASILTILLFGCQNAETFETPTGLPEMSWPEDNPYSADKAELGRHLFYDIQLSLTGARSCGVCHDPLRGFTDGFVVSIGLYQESVDRNALSLLNVGYRQQLSWRNPELISIETQNLVPLMGDDPVEMGIDEDTLEERLLASDIYPALFENAYGTDEITFDNALKALGTFQRTIVGGNTSYDAWLAGDSWRLSATAQRGLDLLNSPELGCYRCHGGTFFESPSDESGVVTDAHSYANNGLYNVDGEGGLPEKEQGLIETTGKAEDMGRFRVPSLRGVLNSGPWMHDGSFLAVEDILDMYARGGRIYEDGDLKGDGALSPYKSPLVTGFEMSKREKEDIMAFFEAISDSDAPIRENLQTPFCIEDFYGGYTNEPCIPQLSFE
jgi:cytochrome c peroxidase